MGGMGDLRRKAAPNPGVGLDGPPPSWPPTCRSCGAVGAPSAEFTPYVVCGGDPAKHVRRPVAAEFVAAQAAAVPAPPPAPVPAVTGPRRQYRAASHRGMRTPPPAPVAPPAPRPQVGQTGPCGTCGRPIGLQAGPDGPVTARHSYAGYHCGGSGWPPRNPSTVDTVRAGVS